MDKSSYDLLLFACLWAGIWQGVLPIVLTLTGRGFWGLAFPALLPSPWVWIVSSAVIVISAALLIVLDGAKKRRHGA